LPLFIRSLNVLIFHPKHFHNSFETPAVFLHTQTVNQTAFTGPAEVDNDWSGRTSGLYGRYFQKEAQKDYRVWAS